MWGDLLAKPSMKLRLFIWLAAYVHGQCEVRPLHESCCEVVRWSAEKVARMMTAIQRWAMALPKPKHDYHNSLRIPLY